jgi:hypothetical protein
VAEVHKKYPIQSHYRIVGENPWSLQRPILCGHKTRIKKDTTHE